MKKQIFDFSEFDHLKIDVDILSEEELFEWLNFLPRFIGVLTYNLEQITNEVNSILVEREIDLSERTDDWLAERRNKIKEDLSVLKRQDEELRDERERIDQEFFRRFAERGTKGTRASRFTISIKEDASYPEITDRTEFEAYVLNTKKLHLLQKRLSLGAIQEELAALQEEHNFYKERLENSSNKIQTAEEIYMELFAKHGDEEGLLRNKINILKATGTLVSMLEQELKEYFSVNGVSVKTKQTINAVKVR